MPNISVKIQLNLHQSKMSHFKWKSPKIFWGGVTAPPQTPPPVGRDTLSPHSTPLGVYGASPLGAYGASIEPRGNVWLRGLCCEAVQSARPFLATA